MRTFKLIFSHILIFLLLSNFSLSAQENLINEKVFSEIQLAQLRFQQELSLIQDKLREDNEPFLLIHEKKTKVSFLLIHGFTASPWEMRDLGQYLHGKGFNVYGMLLDGHGTKEEDLLNTKWEDWSQSVEDAYELTKLIGDEVIVVGLSTGGDLALHLAAGKPEVSGVVSLASAIFFQDWKINFSGIGKYFMKYNFRPLPPVLKHYYYENRAVSAIYEVYKLSGVVKKELKNISQPVLIIQSKNDGTIKPESSEYIYKNVTSKNKKLIFLENSPHVLTTIENPKQNEVFETINYWVENLKF
ncbi:MAG: alpha/beta fold hydrolase [bacterium]|nr:alpha/beta fold hydrolase [bacterium]